MRTTTTAALDDANLLVDCPIMCVLVRVRVRVRVLLRDGSVLFERS